MSTLNDPMRVKAKLGPFPGDLSIRIGPDEYDITSALRKITIRQGIGSDDPRPDRHNPGDYLPIVQLELALVAVEVEGDAQLDVILPENTRAALVALGWLDPERASERQRLTDAVVERAYAYVDAPEDAWSGDPDQEAPDLAPQSYEDLKAAVDRHRHWAATKGPAS